MKTSTLLIGAGVVVIALYLFNKAKNTVQSVSYLDRVAADNQSRYDAVLNGIYNSNTAMYNSAIANTESQLAILFGVNGNNE
jgi:hypothetical protein